MGIPVCRGLHAVSTEDLCMDCQKVIIDRAMVAALEHGNNLREEKLDLDFSGRRRPRREAPPPPPMQYPKKPAAKGGMSVQPRRTDHQG
jgi:hypothetical protein